jgi:hypothetical protein
MIGRDRNEIRKIEPNMNKKSAMSVNTLIEKNADSDVKS